MPASHRLVFRRERVSRPGSCDMRYSETMKNIWIPWLAVLFAAAAACRPGTWNERHYVLHLADNGPVMLKRYALVAFPRGPGDSFVINAEVMRNAFSAENALSPHQLTGAIAAKGTPYSFELKLRTDSKLLLVLETTAGKYYKSYISSLPADIRKDGLVIPELERTNDFPPVSLDGETLEGVRVAIEWVGHTNEHHRVFSF